MKTKYIATIQESESFMFEGNSIYIFWINFLQLQ